MIPTSLAVAMGLSNIFVAQDTYMLASPGGELGSFLATLNSRELIALSEALAGAVPLLALDLPRLRAFADGAVQVDLVETIDPLITQEQTETDVHMLEDLAALVMSPAASTASRAFVSGLANKRSIQDDLRRRVLVRLGEAEPRTDLEHVLNMQLRPGVYEEKQLKRVAPIVYVAEDGSTPTELWLVIAALSRAGARVRRLPRGFSNADRDYSLSDLYPVVFWSSEALSEWTSVTGRPTRRGVHVGPTISQILGSPRLINQVVAQLPATMELRQPEVITGSDASPMHVKNLTAGAFDSAEMCYLGGAGRSTVQRLSREGLGPRNSSSHRWSFDQLITLRLLQSIRARRRIPKVGAKDLLGRIEELTLATESQEVGIDVRGRLFVKERDGYRDIESGQQTLDLVVTVDQAFKSFQFGGGVVPNLLNPGPRVTVHPQVVAGTPTVKDHRVPATVIEQVWRERGEQVLRSAYPELTAAELHDARRVGQGIRRYKVA